MATRSAWQRKLGQANAKLGTDAGRLARNQG